MISPCAVISNPQSQKHYISLNKLEKDENGRMRASFRERDADGSYQTINAVQGAITDIDKSVFRWQEQDILKLAVTMTAKDGSKTIIQCGYASVFARNIITRLNSTEEFDNIRITPYVFSYKNDKGENKDLICASVKRHGEILPICTKSENIPPVRYVVINEKTKQTVRDTGDRDEFYDKLANEVQAKIRRWNYQQERTNSKTPSEKRAEVEEIVENMPDGIDCEIPF